MEAGLDNLAPALVALQADLKPVEKSANNPFFKSKYAPLPAVMEAVQPLLAKHKLAISQFVTHLDAQSALRTILIHESGQTLQDVQPLLITKPDPQAQGSAITYARRYGVMSVLGLVADEDDDGNAGSGRSSAAKQSNASQTAQSGSGAATDKQISLIRKLAEEQGVPDDAINKRVRQIKTSAEASEAISRLKGETS